MTAMCAVPYPAMPNYWVRARRVIAEVHTYIHFIGYRQDITVGARRRTGGRRVARGDAARRTLIVEER